MFFLLQDSPPPTDDELQQFLDYMEAGGNIIKLFMDVFDEFS